MEKQGLTPKLLGVTNAHPERGESTMRGTWWDQPDLDDDGFTRVSNILVDFVFPLIPQNDVALFLYALRRQLGYREERDAGQVRISYKDFIEGRRDAAGMALDLGSGLVRSEVQQSLQHLSAAKMMLFKERGKIGRPRKNASGESEGTLWSVNTKVRLGGWTLAPFFELMTYGQLGRYVMAATGQKVPPPATEEESKLLSKCILAKRKEDSRPIPMPESWDHLEGKIKVFPVHTIKNSTNVKHFNDTNCTTVIQLGGSNSTAFVQLDAEKGLPGRVKSPPKETTNKETTNKETIPPTSLAAKFAGANRSVKPSKDGRKPNEWVAELVRLVYASRGREYPLTLGSQMKWIHELRAAVPVEVVAQYMLQTMKEPFWLNKELTFQSVANNIRGWPQYTQAMRNWEKKRQQTDNLEGDVVDVGERERIDTAPKDGHEGMGSLSRQEGAAERRDALVGRSADSDETGLRPLAEERPTSGSRSALQERLDKLRTSMPGMQGQQATAKAGTG